MKEPASTNPNTADSQRDALMRAKHLEFATKVYESLFDESKMTEDEIKHYRAQIPSIGIVPFRAAWDAALQSRDAEVASLKRQIAEDTLALVRASDEIKQLKEAPMARKDG